MELPESIINEALGVSGALLQNEEEGGRPIPIALNYGSELPAADVLAQIGALVLEVEGENAAHVAEWVQTLEESGVIPFSYASALIIDENRTYYDAEGNEITDLTEYYTDPDRTLDGYPNEHIPDITNPEVRQFLAQQIARLAQVSGGNVFIDNIETWLVANYDGNLIDEYNGYFTEIITTAISISQDMEYPIEHVILNNGQVLGEENINAIIQELGGEPSDLAICKEFSPDDVGESWFESDARGFAAIVRNTGVYGFAIAQGDSIIQDLKTYFGVDQEGFNGLIYNAGSRDNYDSPAASSDVRVYGDADYFTGSEVTGDAVGRKSKISASSPVPGNSYIR
jgi:hypothetical protein